ncbi:coproporphyrinogen III oxidase, partial [Acidobacteria bacterium AH-259-A15]|nr:coproporphyrinogen III oxidase [Acidobacteria bacterium AH-259-A15]
ILEVNGRAHHSKEIFRAYDFARSISFPQINIDLIAGMVEEMPEKWYDCVRQAVALEADSVTIYQMEIPYNTVIYQQMKARGDLVAPVASWRTKREWVKYAFAEFEKAGYTVTSGYTAVKDPSRTHFVYRDQLWKGADLIGLGVSSFGHIGGTHYQNEHDFHPYLAKLEEGALPVYRALKLTDEERLIRELILQMKLGGISRKYFQAKFEVDICERFAEPIGALQEAGFLQRSGDDVMLSREGLLCVDRLLPGFFLPKHQNARYT